jgi:NAD(P)-dependent dehydrogenase (short-subunit alcohol dehydrogenase family)
VPRFEVAGSRAVVTGAGSGIGRAFAQEISRRGGAVVCADVDLQRAEVTAEQIRSTGGKAEAAGCDVSALEQVEALSESVESLFGAPADLLVNNAGVGSGGWVIGDLAIEDWRWTIRTNLWGAVHGCHVFVPAMRRAQSGAVINVASAAAFASAPTMAAYNVSKAGVVAKCPRRWQPSCPGPGSRSLSSVPRSSKRTSRPMLG